MWNGKFKLLATCVGMLLAGMMAKGEEGERKTAWLTSKIVGSPEAPLPYQAERAFPKLSFDQPVEMTMSPDGKRWYVLELRGKVFSFPHDPQCPQADLCVNLADAIPGFRRGYGWEFHPNFQKNRLVYVCYVLKEGDPHGTRVSSFRMEMSDPPKLDIKSEQVLIDWYSGGHNGGSLKFGPDGMLYISTGDGASPSPPDVHDSGQNINDLLASVLRIDVNTSDENRPYGIPQDNPFYNTPGARQEVWAYGLRNPWRMSFDSKLGHLWVGDVGWEMFEMVYRIERGGNYGWSVKEGSQSVRPEATPGPSPILPPVLEHSHIESRSLTGGYVYRGSRLPDLQGAYIYGDYVTGLLWGVRYDGQKVTWQQRLAETPLQVICFGQHQNGELYVVDYTGGIFQLVPNTSDSFNRDFPQKLSQTGLFQSTVTLQPAAGVLPYHIQAEPWADGAKGQRWVAVPQKEQIGLYTAEENNVQVGNLKGAWKFPAGSVLVKMLSLELTPGDPSSKRRLETQILHRNGETWKAYTYLWNDEQTDATLAPAAGLDVPLTLADASAPNGKRQQTWHVSARSECLVCHTTRAGSIHGFQLSQLSTKEVNNATVHSLRVLGEEGLFAQSPPEPVYQLVNPFDSSLDLTARARSYLHVNCAHCHRRGGGGTAAFELMADLDLEKTKLIGERPTQGTFQIRAAQVVAPSDPFRSVLLYRMAKLGRGHMPHAGSNVVDTAGVRLLHDWIAQLPIPAGAAQTDYQRAAANREQEAKSWSQLAVAATVPAALDSLLATPSGALKLWFAMPELAEPLRQEIISRGVKHPLVEVRDLFESFVPESQRVKRLGTVVDAAQLLQLPGNAERGRQLWFKESGVQCRNCHRIGQEGKEVGPELTQVAKKNTKAQLLESILEPSKTIDPKWANYLLETSDGRVLGGLLLEKTATEVTLKDPQGQVIRIPTADVEVLTPTGKSLMPELQLRDLTAAQVADLLEFLQTLK